MDLSKVDKRSYVKIVFLHGRNARECHAELREALVIGCCIIKLLHVGWKPSNVDAKELLTCHAVDVQSLLTQKCKWLDQTLSNR